jgi:hypothetical protein
MAALASAEPTLPITPNKLLGRDGTVLTDQFPTPTLSRTFSEVFTKGSELPRSATPEELTTG